MKNVENGNDSVYTNGNVWVRVQGCGDGEEVSEGEKDLYFQKR